MRQQRRLSEDVWYGVSTAVNVGEPLFELRWTKPLFCRVLRDAKGIYSFEMSGFKLEGATLSFYIKPADGKELPKIMQWVMNSVHETDVLGAVQRDRGEVGAAICGKNTRTIEGTFLKRVFRPD
jgi:hypothetical protein